MLSAFNSHFHPYCMSDDITTEQAMQNAIDQYAMQKARMAFGYFYTFGGREKQVLPTEDIMQSVEAVFKTQ